MAQVTIAAPESVEARDKAGESSRRAALTATFEQFRTGLDASVSRVPKAPFKLT